MIDELIAQLVAFAGWMGDQLQQTGLASARYLRSKLAARRTPRTP